MYDVENQYGSIVKLSVGLFTLAVKGCDVVSPLSYYLPSREMPWDVDVDVVVEPFSNLDDEHSSHIKSSSTVLWIWIRSIHLLTLFCNPDYSLSLFPYRIRCILKRVFLN